MTERACIAWRLVHVSPPQVDVAMTLTSGLDRLREHPDLLVFDMPKPTAARYLDALGERVRAGADLRAGSVVGDLHESFRFGLVDVGDREFLLGLGQWDVTRRRRPFRPLLQLVWPDLCGTLPWEPDYDLSTGGLRQPLLGRWPLRRTG
jgi:Domain of unknown function (DUF4262)